MSTGVDIENLNLNTGDPLDKPVFKKIDDDMNNLKEATDQHTIDIEKLTKSISDIKIIADNSKTEVESHSMDTNNPHNTTISQIKDVDIDTTKIVDGQVFSFNGTTKKWEAKNITSTYFEFDI